ncbi:MAG: AIM24 family protein [Synechococcaceae cyanobacterium SM1_2_3]|nr:AIM24 family protein [Synechococcaceae cyanobacterium SM1_2_3]
MSEDCFEVLQKQEIAGAVFEIVQYKALQGSDDLLVAEKIFMVNQADIHLKMIRVRLNQSELIIEPGALYFMRGHLQLESGIQGGIASGLMRKFTSGETLFQSRIKGSGEIYLEPTFGHYLLFTIDQDALIVDKGAFFCASANMQVSSKLQKNISSALFGGEGLFQTLIKGSGIVVLNSPVPVHELLMYELAAGEKLSVDGNFAFVRSDSVAFHAENLPRPCFSPSPVGRDYCRPLPVPVLSGSRRPRVSITKSSL